MNTFTATVEVPENIVAEARHRKASSDSYAPLDEFILDHVELELDY